MTLRLRQFLAAVFLLVTVFPGSGLTQILQGDTDGSAGLRGDQMVGSCLAGNEQLECLSASGFTCEAKGNVNRNGYSCFVSYDGGCYRTRFSLKASGWSSNYESMNGQCATTGQTNVTSGVRMQFNELTAPDSVLFKMFVAAMFRDNIDQGQHRMGRSYIRPGANAETDYDQVTLFFASKYLEIEREIHDTQKEILCEDGNARYSDSTLFEVLDRFDDISIEVYARHLEMTKATEVDNGKFDLDEALAGFPAVFTMTVISTSGSLPELQSIAARICSEPFRRSFTTIE